MRLLERLPVLRKLDLHMREIAHGTTVAFFSNVVGAGLSFLLTVLVARLLGAQGAGLFFLSLTCMTIGAVLGRLGLDNALLRFVAAGSAVADWAEVKGVHRNAMALASAASATAAVVLFAFAPPLARDLFAKPALASPLRIFAIALLPISLLTLQSEALKGVKRIFISQVLNGSAVPALALASLGVLALIEEQIQVDHAAWAFTTAALASALAGSLFWRHATPRLRTVRGHFPIRRLLRTSIPLFGVAAMNVAMAWAAVLILGIWATSADVGIFTAATRTASLTSLILISVNSIAAPKFAELYRRRDFTALSSTARHTTVLMTLLASPILILFVVVPGHVMGLFGAEFREGGLLLTILALGQFVNVATGSVGYLLIMSGNENLLRNQMAVAASLNIILCLALIPWAGRVGAAIASATSIAALNLGAAWLVARRLGIPTIPFVGRLLLRRASGE